jgi:hypothetical protein
VAAHGEGARRVRARYTEGSRPGRLRAGRAPATRASPSSPRAAVPNLWARGVYLHFLPPYSPELNEIEPAFRVIKHDELPERRYATVPARLAAVDTAFTAYEERRIAKHAHHLRPAA